MWIFSPVLVFYVCIIWMVNALSIDVRNSNTMHFRKIGEMAGTTAMGHVLLTVNMTKHLEYLHHGCSLPKRILKQDVTLDIAQLANEMSATCQLMQDTLLERKLIWNNQFYRDRKRTTYGKRQMEEEDIQASKAVKPWEQPQSLRRSKRQLFVLLGLAVAAIVVGISSMYSTGELGSIAEAADNSQNTNIKVLQEHQSRLGVDERSISILNRTVSALEETTQWLNDKVRLAVMMSQANLALQTIFAETVRIIRGLNSLSNRRLSPDLVRSSEMLTAITKLRSDMAMERFELGILHYEEIFACEVSHIVTAEGMLIVYLHLPAVKQGTKLSVMQYVPVPAMLSDNTGEEEMMYSLIPKPREHYLAVSRDETNYRAFTTQDMQQCKVYGETIYCPNANILDKRPTSSCLMALYKRDEKTIESSCQWQIHPAEDFSLQLSANKFLLYQRGKKEIKLACGEETAEKVVNGLMEIYVPEGCLLYSTSFIFEGQVNFSVALSDYTEKTLNISDLLTGGGEIDMSRLIDAMKEAHLVGSAEGLSIENMKSRYQQSWSNYHWAWSTRGISGSAMAIILVVGIIYYIKQRRGDDQTNLFGRGFASFFRREAVENREIPLATFHGGTERTMPPDVPANRQYPQVTFRPIPPRKPVRASLTAQEEEDYIYSAEIEMSEGVDIREAARMALLQRAEDNEENMRVTERPATVSP